jgi:hypothetical protein
VTAVRAKLQLRPNQRITIIGAPDGLDLDPAGDGSGAEAAPADAVIVFVRTAAELRGQGAAALEAARRDSLAWIAYPKAGQLGTDLNRDLLAALLVESGVQPVRQVAIDDAWSGLRIRPAR